MKKYNLIYGIFISVLFLNSGCESDANVTVPSTERKLVVGGFLSPEDNEHQISLTLSEPLFSSDPFFNTTTANVTISSEGNAYQASYDVDAAAFVFNNSQFNIASGKNYHLKIVAENGKTVEADMTTVSDTMPSIEEFKINVDTIYSEWASYEYRYNLKLNWKDIAGEKNYYRLTANRLVNYLGTTDTTIEPIYEYNSFTLKDDIGKDGQSLSATFKYNDYSLTNETVGFEIVLMKIDVNYYNYYKTLNNYAGEDPFAEPVILFSNIQNGLGVFSSFQSHKIRRIL
jgi:hypothetical protein